MIRNGKELKDAIILAVFLIITAFGCGEPERGYFTHTFYSMGTIVELEVSAYDSVKAAEAINKAVEEITRLDEKYSTYKKESYLSKLNNDTAGKIKVDAETFAILKICDRIYKLTKGKFDAALGAIIDISGFKDSVDAEIDPEKIKEAVSNNGWKFVRLAEPDTLIRLKPVKFNFGGVVKGYAVDRMMEKIRETGISDAYLNAGGEVKIMGESKIIGIQHPRNPDTLLLNLKLKDMAVATSGDYEQYRRTKNGIVTHIIDPSKGITYDYNRSVSVISDSAIIADALATGFLLLKEMEIFSIIDKLRNIEAVVVDSKGNLFKSGGLKKLLIKR